jgi:hypothetical protein
MNKHDKIIEEYKNYIKHNILGKSFDFNTWAQHQYGISPNININLKLLFDVIDIKNSNK